MDKIMRKDVGFVALCAYCAMTSVLVAVHPGASRWETLLVGLLVWSVSWLTLAATLPVNLPTPDKAVITVAFAAVATAAIFLV